MSNRPRDAIKWDKPVQVMVSEETQSKLKVLSRKAETTISGLCREILDSHVSESSTSTSC